MTTCILASTGTSSPAGVWVLAILIVATDVALLLHTRSLKQALTVLLMVGVGLTLGFGGFVH